MEGAVGRDGGGGDADLSQGLTWKVQALDGHFPSPPIHSTPIPSTRLANSFSWWRGFLCWTAKWKVKACTSQQYIISSTCWYRRTQGTQMDGRMDGLTSNSWSRSASREQRCVHLSCYLGQYRRSIIHKYLGIISVIFQDSNPFANSHAWRRAYLGPLYDRWKHARLDTI